MVSCCRFFSIALKVLIHTIPVESASNCGGQGDELRMGSGFRIEVSGFRVYGLGYSVYHLGLGFRV